MGRPRMNVKFSFLSGFSQTNIWCLNFISQRFIVVDILTRIYTISYPCLMYTHTNLSTEEVVLEEKESAGIFKILVAACPTWKNSSASNIWALVESWAPSGLYTCFQVHLACIH